ncbi:Rpn family recombination-promoting nuclease/putative transposase [Jiangella alba]
MRTARILPQPRRHPVSPAPYLSHHVRSAESARCGVRRVLGEPVNAASQLRAVLPAGVTDRLDGGTPTLLFTAPVEGREAFLYVLIEHQSSTDPLMPFRMLRYVVRIWEWPCRCRRPARPRRRGHRGGARAPAPVPVPARRPGPSRRAGAAGSATDPASPDHAAPTQDRRRQPPSRRRPP